MKDLSVKSQLDLENNKILNGTTDTPTLPESIVNKKYVDEAMDNIHPIFIGRDIFDLTLNTDHSITTFINTFYGDTTHNINDLKTDLDKIFSGCPVTIAEVNNSSTKTDNKLSSANIYLKVNKDYFLGYRDFKLTWIDPFNKGRLKFLYLTFPQQSSGNINYLVSDEYNLTPDSYESDSDIIPTSTSSSKKISDRLNNINLTGDVYKGQTYYDNTNNQLSISTYRRNAVVGIETDKSKPWFKFASFTSNKRAYLDSQISFHVSTGYGDRTKIIGILTAHFRTGTDYKWESGELTWSLCGDTIDPTHFVLAHNDQDPCVVELWCKCVYLYAGYHFDVIAENTRNATTERTWQLTQSWNKNGQTEITSGYTQIVSSYIQLKPNFNDRGFIKLKPNKDTDFSFNSSNLNLNSVEYLKVGTFRANTDAIAQSLTNCPTKCGFVMYVNDPLNLNIDNETTATYVYRLREIRDWQGNIYYQAASSSNTPGTFTYSNWINITVSGSDMNLKVDKSDLGLTTFKVTRTASTSSNGYGYWAAMLNSSQTGSPVLPSTNKWWHVLSMDWSGTTNNNTSWVSQLALPTNDGGVPHYRRNTTNNTAIDSSTWHKFITDENIADQTVSKATSATSATKATQDSDGNKINTTYLKLSGGTMTGNINFLNGNNMGIYWKENGYGDKFKICPAFSGSNDDNLLKIQGAVGGAGTDPSLYDLVTISGKSGNVKIKGNVQASTFTGNLNGNASTATKLQTDINVQLSGDVTSNVTKMDSNNKISISTYRKGGCVGQSGNTTTKPWYKFASCTLDGAYSDRNIVFNVYQGYGDASAKVGILIAHFRTNSNKIWESGELRWLIKTTQMPASDFILAHNTTAPCVVELWCKCPNTYTGYHFDVISEGDRSNRGNYWTLYNNFSAGSQNAITSGYKQITSVVDKQHIEINTRNTTDTWIPVLKSGELQYTSRVISTSKTHTNYNTEQDRIPTLSFLTFWNGAYNSSNNSNLTYAHQGTIQCKPTTLYSNASGTKGTVTLSQNATNFAYLDIFYLNNNGVGDSYNRLSVSRNGNYFVLSNNSQYKAGGDSIHSIEIRTTYYKLSGTSITVSSSSYILFRNKAINTMTNDNFIYIYKVIGYK